MSMLHFTTFLRTFYAPIFWYGRLKLNTIENYLQSVKQYLSIVGDVKINEITPANNARFVNELQRQGTKIETIRKHCRHLNTIFAKMGPPGSRNRDAFGWLPTAPWIRPPESYHFDPREVSDSQFEQLYRATLNFPECYEYPKYLEPALRPQWWRALLCLAATTAFRRGVLFSLRWRDVSVDSRFIIVPPDLDKKRRQRKKPLHAQVYRFLESVRNGEKLLEWTHGNKRFYAIWHGLNEFAGIKPHLKLHDLKRYALQHACRSGIDAATLQMLGDHASLKTTLDHYAHGNLENYVKSIRLPNETEVENG